MRFCVGSETLNPARLEGQEAGSETNNFLGLAPRSGDSRQRPSHLRGCGVASQHRAASALLPVPARTELCKWRVLEPRPRSGEPRSEPRAQRPAAEALVRDRAEARSGRAGRAGRRRVRASQGAGPRKAGRRPQAEGRGQSAESGLARRRAPPGRNRALRAGLRPAVGRGPRVATSPERLPGPRRGACLLPTQPPQPRAPVSRVAAGACEREARAASREDPYGGRAGAGARSPEPSAWLSNSAKAAIRDELGDSGEEQR
ncbi:uncharacterized protein LOC116575934 [Mustela erminea]|uniref:uncharacterized protein LOC116575934 n=1 Tax=Mustela erminea TaxID=36723 RepID=UPI00138728BF|nr:uncharacterized protein LOC116575934 [Mustela erminea]